MKGSNTETGTVELGLLQELLGYHLRRAQLAFFNGFSSACEDLGLSPGLFAVLEVVYRNPGLTQTAVSKALGTDRSAMVAAIDKLEGMNLIERRACKSDRRSYALFATDHCREWYPTAEARVRAHEKIFEDRLEPGEREQLIRILSRLTSDSTEE